MDRINISEFTQPRRQRPADVRGQDMKASNRSQMSYNAVLGFALSNFLASLFKTKKRPT